MAKKKHLFDVVAEKLETMAARPAADQDPSPDYWELHFPLARREATPIKVDPAVYDGGQEGLGPDGFPKVPIPEMKLKGSGRLTDVVLTELPVSWSVGYLYSEKALAVFKQFELGIFREYPVAVSGGKDIVHPLTYLLILCSAAGEADNPEHRSRGCAAGRPRRGHRFSARQASWDCGLASDVGCQGQVARKARGSEGADCTVPST